MAVGFLIATVAGTFAQPNTPQLEGWQGPRPVPQQPPAVPAPQNPVPSGKQVLEIPPQVQQPAPRPPTQQTLPIPRRQPETTRPTQFITVTVTDPHGHYVPGLTREDFLLYEDDVSQEITYFNTGQDEPVSLGFIVDTSGSMLNKITQARRALRSFMNTIRPQDEVFLEAFNQQPTVLQDFTDSRALLLQATSLLQPQGETALYDAILDGLHRVQQGRRQKKVLVVITDGLDGTSTASREQTIAAIRRSGVVVYTIGVGNPEGGLRAVGGGRMGPSPFFMPHRRGGPAMGSFRGGPMMGPPMGSPTAVVDETVDSRTLQTLSEETGGRNFLLNTADVIGNMAVLDEATQAISVELRQQYSLGYLSPLKGDLYRGVRVETRRGGLVVRTRKGIG